MLQQPPTSQCMGPQGVAPGVLASLCAQAFKQPNGASSQRGSEQVSEEMLLFVKAQRDNIEPEFNDLVKEWKNDRNATSSTTVIVMHPAYQRIIGMGKPVLPFILRELNQRFDHWFWALKAISGEDPVPPEHRGKMKQMAIDWLQWGQKRGYVR